MRVSPEQLRRSLADMFRDPETRGLIFPSQAPWLAVRGGAPTLNYIPKYQSDPLILDITATPIFENGTGVGIGTTSPNSRLDLGANLNARNVTWYDDRSNGWGLETNNNLSGLGGAYFSNVTYGGVDFIWRQKAYADRNNPTVAGTPLMTVKSGGTVGIGTTSPGAKLHVITTAADLVALIAQGAASQSANLQQWKNSAGDVLASVTKDGSLVFKGTATKQSSGGPELITAIHSAQDNVILWAGLSSDTEARFLCSARGFLEWGPGGSGDQEIALYRNAGAGISIGNFFTSGPPLPSVNAFRVNAPSPSPPGNEGTAVFRVDTDKQAGVRVRGRRPFTASGTVATTATSATVTDTSTAFTTEIIPGDIITIVDTGETRTVKSVTDNTHLVADSAFSSNETSSNMVVATFSGFAGTESVRTTAAVQTTNSSLTTIATIPLEADRAYYVVVRIAARRSDGSARAFITRAAVARRESGGTGYDEGDLSGSVRPSPAGSWECSFSTSGNDLVVSVRTPNETITVYWAATIEYQSISTNS